jgi:hypothetical protein
MMAYRSAGGRIPRVSRWQYEVGQRVAVRQLVPGDLVFYARNPCDPAPSITSARTWPPGPAWPPCRPACGPPAPAWRWTAPSVRSRRPPCGASSTPTAWPQTARSAAPPGKRRSATDASGAARQAAERSTSTTRSGRGAVRSDRVAKPRRWFAPTPTGRDPPAAVPHLGSGRKRAPWFRTQTGSVARWPSAWGPSPVARPTGAVARWQGMRRASGRADLGDRPEDPIGARGRGLRLHPNGVRRSP